MRGLGLLALVAACGDGVPGPDAAIGSDGAVRGRVSVHVDGPEEGFEEVFFQNADSSLVLSTRTNGDGDAMALMEPGGFVTVYDGNQLYTWTDVQIGDELVLAPQTFGGATNFFPDIELHVAPYEGAFEYMLYVPCDFPSPRDVLAATTGAMFPGFTTCAATVDMMLVAGDPSPIAYQYRANVLLTTISTLTLSGTYKPMQDTTVDVTTLPDVTDVFIASTLDDVPYSAADSLFPIDGRATAHLRMPTGSFPSRTIAQASTFSGKEDAAITSTVRAVSWGPVQASTALDLSLRDLTGSPTLDLTSYRVSWSEAPVGLEANVVILALQTDDFTLWNVIAAHADMHVQLPVLPHPQFRLSESSNVSSYSMIAIDGGYDFVRPDLLGHWSTNEPRFPGTSGHATYRTPF